MFDKSPAHYIIVSTEVETPSHRLVAAKQAGGSRGKDDIKQEFSGFGAAVDWSILMELSNLSPPIMSPPPSP